ncbi:aldolase/citrate lyase family protein [Methylobacterium sp. NEAU 140]|uniref:HpcH/HpaI aldolase family protein n=1 Tax=Methylobacterium sp. NEAU 140 TaxID=3064945 RepID=UPI0027376813|nr:aldolase/citrate lyase family protein [Methylobacterium sp. NEAU 140]MDP4023146.1 aldolase/citrate lyase family protein [Methylobacterium sp. NEAU 140]
MTAGAHTAGALTAPVPSLSERLRDGAGHLLGWACLGDPAVAGMMARAGFDAVLLDQQHGTFEVASTAAALTELALSGTPGLVRVAVGDFAMASRMLDAGAAGIVAPMINTVADARALAAATKYPPVGQRSWGPDRAMWFSGQGSGSDYLATANARTTTIAMCETREAIDGLAGILAVPGIDGILVGPSDLSIALSDGAALDPLGAAVTAALEEIVRRTREAGKVACAFGHSPERAREMIGMGFHLVSVGYDAMLVAGAFAAALRIARA